MKNLLQLISQGLIDVIAPEHRPLKFASLPYLIFLGMCFSLLIAYPIYAANGGTLTKPDSFAIGILIISILSLSIYLFWVIFQPEKF